MQIRHIVQRIAPVMYLELHIVRLRQMRYLDERRYPARHRHIPAQYVGGVALYPVRHPVQPARRVLGGHYRYVHLGAQLDIAIDVLLHQRILIPEEVQLLYRAPHPHRIFVAVRPHRVQHQRHIRPHRLAHRLAYLYVLFRNAVRVYLVRRPAYVLEMLCLLSVLLRRIMPSRAGIRGNLIPACANKLVNGQACHLALDVPQRHIDRADGVCRRPPVLPPHIPPYRAAVKRIPAHHQRLQKLQQRRRVVIRPLA